MNNAAEQIEKTIDIVETAGELLDKHNGSREKAARDLGELVRSNDPAFRALMMPLVDGAVWDCVRRADARERRRLQAVGNHKPSSGATTPRNGNAGLKKIADDWLRYPIYGGIRLGDATKADLINARDGYAALEQGNRRGREVMERIIPKVPKDKKVREVLKSEQIAALWQ
jgi:hypothetical protein